MNTLLPMNNKIMHSAIRIIVFAAVLLLSACATIEGPENPDDPWESYNRSMYQFNDALDRTIIKPVAEGYVAITPNPVRKGVSNFFSNLDTVLVIINDLLQLKLVQAVSDTTRLFLNTTIGIFGIFDPASAAGMDKNNEDFGQTLGYWGVPSGPYLVLPFFGPSSPRDGLGLYVDSAEFDLVWNGIEDNSDRNLLLATKIINTRASLLNASNLLDVAALDPYQFLRDGYRQRRQNLVYDGNPPVDELDMLEGDDVFSDDW